MKEIILPHNFKVPYELRFKGLYLEALAPKHNKMDYEAWNSCKASLRGIFGPHDQWPYDVLNENENLRDLKKHYHEFLNLEAYAYTILEEEFKEKCVGCLYIRKTPHQKFDCRVDFWFVDDYRHYERDFFIWIKEWLRTDWEMNCVAFPGREISWSEYLNEEG
jgi:hypothetical protein